MDKELQQYYETRFKMFTDKGWRDLMDDVAKMRQSTDTLVGVSDAKVLHFRQGELSILDWLLSLEKVSREAYDELRGEA